MAMVSAVQEAQKDNVRSFNDYMMTVLEVCTILLVNIIPIYFDFAHLFMSRFTLQSHLFIFSSLSW